MNPIIKDLLYGFISSLMLVFIVLAVVTARADDKHFEFVQPVDDYVQSKLVWDDTRTAGILSDWTLYAMIVWPIVEATNGNQVLKRTATLGFSHGVVSLLTQQAKNEADRTRPNGNGDKSFFSGHTSAAFTGAAFLCATESNTKCGVGLGLAATTGYLRMAADKHWFSDVLVSALVGYGLGYAVPVYAFDF